MCPRCNVQFKCKYGLAKTFLFQAIQFSISMPGQSEPGSDGKKGVLCIPQSSSITGTSTPDCLVSYPGHSLGGVVPLCRGAVGVFYSPNRLGKRCNGYRHKNLKRWLESKTWTRLIAFHVALKHLGKVWIQLLYMRWVNIWVDWAL